MHTRDLPSHMARVRASQIRDADVGHRSAVEKDRVQRREARDSPCRGFGSRVRHLREGQV